MECLKSFIVSSFTDHHMSLNPFIHKDTVRLGHPSLVDDSLELNAHSNRGKLEAVASSPVRLKASWQFIPSCHP